jgi:hypothetical protein
MEVIAAAAGRPETYIETKSAVKWFLIKASPDERLRAPILYTLSSATTMELMNNYSVFIIIQSAPDGGRIAHTCNHGGWE